MARFADGVNLLGIVRETVKNCRGILRDGDNSIPEATTTCGSVILSSVWRLGKRWAMLGDHLCYCLDICFWPLLEVTV